MLLIFGGTTEGRIAIQVAEEAEKPFLYSTFGLEQRINLVHGLRITGAMEAADMIRCIDNQGVRLIVDAAHPFALNLHRNIEQAASERQVPVIRLERNYDMPTTHNDDIVYVNDYQEALTYLNSVPRRKVLFLTGLHTIPKFQDYWQPIPERCFFRILNRDESRAEALSYGIPESQLLYFNEANHDEELYHLPTPTPDLVVSKESGKSGYFASKVEYARQVGATLLVIRRPPLSEAWTEVSGPWGLRLAIERLYPDFFDLHCGYTTGSCATAAAKAATLRLFGKDVDDALPIHLPDGEQIRIPIHISTPDGYAEVIKMAGDDPDVTQGRIVAASVRLTHEYGITFRAGVGVGTVTLPGLGLPVGGPAINKVPREMITYEVMGLLNRYAPHRGAEVTISVPDGEELAAKTFNPRLGVVGGISIIGTSGIVKPFSHEAFVSSIRKEMQVAQAMGEQRIILNSGARSLKTMQDLYPDASNNAFIHYGNFIGEALKLTQELSVGKVALGLMIGKAVKLAEGHADTHSRKVQMNKDFVCELAHQSGCSNEIRDHIQLIVMARELLEILPPDSPFYETLLSHCTRICQQYYSAGSLTLYLIHDKGHVIATRHLNNTNKQPIII